MAMERTDVTVRLEDDCDPQGASVKAKVSVDRLGIGVQIDLFDRVAEVFIDQNDSRVSVHVWAEEDLDCDPTWSKTIFTVPGSGAPFQERPV
ncbi:hypothetical protein ACFLWA_12095 [Chloroflexota bacterium]